MTPRLRLADPSETKVSGSAALNGLSAQRECRFIRRVLSNAVRAKILSIGVGGRDQPFGLRRDGRVAEICHRRHQLAQL
jgi:hypothetical protein